MSWSVAGRLATQGISLAGTLAVVRLLPPAEYGIVGMSRLIMGLIDVFRDFGLTNAVIQRPALTEELLSTVFWANIALGFAATTLAALVAPWAAAFYRAPQAAPLIAALSLSLLLTGTGNVQYALLSRELRFKRVVQIEAFMAIGSTATLIAAALRGYGAWSFVYSALVSSGIGTVLLWAGSSWRPRLIFDWKEMRSIAGFSSNLTGYNLVNYFSRNADNILVGRYLGAAQLGYYTVAYNAMLYPVMGVTHVLGRVLFPAFSQMQEQGERFRQAYLKSTGIIALITLPITVEILVNAREIVEIVLGPKWFPVVRLLQILAPVGMLQTLSATTGSVFFAKGRTDWLFRWEIFSTLCFVSAFASGLRWGLNGVAASYLLMNLLLIYPSFAIPFRLIPLPFPDFLRVVKHPLLATLYTGVVTLALAHFFSMFPSIATELHLGITLLGSATFYILLMAWWRPPAVQNILQHFGWSRLKEEVFR